MSFNLQIFRWLEWPPTPTVADAGIQSPLSTLLKALVP
jgi:hypothetical protein